jgi:DNA modification methylase
MKHALGQRSRSLDSLREHPDNPRTIEPGRLDQLKRNLAEDPGMLKARPVIALPDGTVIAGNMRLRAARELGWKTIPVYTVELDDATARLWMLRDNSAFGDWEQEGLAAMLASLDDVDLELTGLDPATVDELLNGGSGGRSEPPEPGPVPKRPRSKAGQVYELGPYRLMCGDATKHDAVSRLLDGERGPLVFTSPPYLDARTYGGTAPELEQLVRFIPACSPHVDIVCVNLGLLWRDGELVTFWDAYTAAARGAGLKLLAWNVWNREDATNLAAQQMTFPTWHEFVFVYGERPLEGRRVLPTKGARTKPIGQRGQDGAIKSGTAQIHERKRLGSVLTTPSHKGPTEGDHPAVFPPELPSAYLLAVTERGELVLDPFAGSGTTLIAAELLGRRAFLMEIDPGYCDVIRDRWERWLEQDVEAA